MKPIVNLYKLGRLPYVKALNIQQVLFDHLKHSKTSQNKTLDVGNHNKPIELDIGGNDGVILGGSLVEPRIQNFNSSSLILVEHEPVYTIGLRSKQYTDNYVSKLKTKLAELKLKADFVKTNRGGLITFHGPGQLVAYPILSLSDFSEVIRNRSVKAYVNALELTIIETLDRIGIPGAHTVREYPGVWVDNGERKIAFVGIACKRFVTMHGISINCDCDLSWFDHIISCGIEDKQITSIRQEMLLQQSNRSMHGDKKIVDSPPMDRQHKCTSKSSTDIDNFPESNLENVTNAFISSFSDRFNCTLKDAPKLKIAI